MLDPKAPPPVLYELLARVSPAAMFMCSADGWMAFVNPAWCEMAGIAEDKALGAAWLDAVHPDDRARVIRVWSEAVTAQRDHVCDYRFERPHGTLWVESRARVVRGDAGRTIGWVGTLTDITALRRADAAARRSDGELRRYKKLFEISSAMLAISRDGAFEVTNPEWTRVLGWTSEELMGRRVADLVVDDEERAHGTKARERIFEGTAPVSCELRCLHKDGSVRWIRATSAFEPLSRRVYTVGHAVTAERNLRRELEDHGELSRYAGALAGVGGWQLDVLSGARRWTGEMYRMTGLPPGEPPPAETVSAMFAAEDRARLDAAIQACIDSGQAVDLEAPLDNAQGERLWVRILARPVVHLGRTVAIRGVFKDITERKIAEEELLGATQAARAASQVKSRFLATMSHEIRTPLNGILGTTELMLSSNLPDELREYAEAARASGRILLDLLDNVLDISKIEAGQMDIEKVTFDVRAVALQAARAVAPRSDARGVEVVVDVAADVPLLATGDPTRLRQVLLNLAGNAAKFTAEGEIELRVRRAGRDGLRFIVRDTGSGIARDLQERVFSAFTQADASTARRHGGTGLGLAISRQLVERMGGRLSLYSEPGRGATFTVELPVPALGPAPPATVRLDGKRILVVDDNALSRRMLSVRLAEVGADVVSADGVSALVEMRDGAVTGNPFAAVLIDFGLPDIDGLALASAMHRDPQLRAVPRLLLCTTACAITAEEQAHAGIAATLLKPLDGDAVVAAIEKLLSAAPRPSATAPAVQRLGLDVLIAEDNSVNALILRRLVERDGHRVRHVADGEAAVKANAEERFDVIFMDVQMPVLDGLGATRVIRSRELTTGQRVPIIALTASAMRADEIACRAADMDDFLSKPIDPQRLRESLARLLRDKAAA